MFFHETSLPFATSLKIFLNDGTPESVWSVYFEVDLSRVQDVGQALKFWSRSRSRNAVVAIERPTSATLEEARIQETELREFQATSKSMRKMKHLNQNHFEKRPNPK